MSPISKRLAQLVVLSMLAIGSTGCQTFNLDKAFSLHGNDERYVGLEPAFAGDQAEEIYHKVRQAAASNSIVLNVIGDSEVRVLPLPPGQKSVFVSNLLKDTGVLKKLGTIDAVMYRHSKDTIGGIRMNVQMTNDKRTVRPESDYALKPGDRLEVRKATHPTIDKLIEMAIGV